MRWSGQQVLDDGVGSELALPGLRGLLRTVRVPEFAGVTFHEVEAKSALNRVPGDSPVPFRWTVNPYRGCGHACVYCLDGATRVLLADGRTRPIADLRPGEAVLGTAVDAVGARRYVPTPVLAHWSTTKPAPPGHARGRHHTGGQRRAPLPDRGGDGGTWRPGGAGPGAADGCAGATSCSVRAPCPLARSTLRPTGRATCTAWSVQTRQGECWSATAGSTRRSRRSASSWRRSAGPTTSSPSRRPTARAHPPVPPPCHPTAAGAHPASRPCGAGASVGGGQEARPPDAMPGWGRRAVPPERAEGSCPRGRPCVVRRNRTTTGARGCSVAWRTPRHHHRGRSPAEHGGRGARGAGHRGAAPPRVRLRVEKVEAGAGPVQPRRAAYRRSGSLRLEGGGRELLRFLAVADPAVSRCAAWRMPLVGGDPGLEVVDISPVGARSRCSTSPPAPATSSPRAW